MKTRVVLILGIRTSTLMLIIFTYHTIEITKVSETEQECDMQIHQSQYYLDFANSTHRNQYTIKNGCISDISHNHDEHSIMISFYQTNDGTIQIMLPEFFYELEPRFEHIVLVDGRQTEFEQLAPSALQIDFIKSTKTIEIIDFMSTPEFSNPTVRNSSSDATVQIKKILYHCNADRSKPAHVYTFSNSTHYIDSNICKWQKDSVLADIIDRCDQIKQTGTFGGFAHGSSWQNHTHYIDNHSCEWKENKN